VASVPLARVKAGTRVRITAIPDRTVRVQALRMGLPPGSEAVVLYRIPGGPVILGCGDQELALGHALAASIEVDAGRAPAGPIPSSTPPWRGGG